MRTHALLMGGGLALSLLLPPTNAQAFFWSFDQVTRPMTPQPAYEGQAYRAEAGYGDRSHTLQAAYGGQSGSQTNAGPSVASTPSTRQVVDFPTSQPPGSIVNVIQTGYVIGDRLLRPAMVTVARRETAPSPEGAGS